MDDWIESDIRVQEEFTRIFPDFKLNLFNGYFLSKADSPISIHFIRIPVTRWGHVEFPILWLVWDGDEELEAGGFP